MSAPTISATVPRPRSSLALIEPWTSTDEDVEQADGQGYAQTAQQTVREHQRGQIYLDMTARSRLS